MSPPTTQQPISPPKNAVFNIPNSLTAIRILAVPAVVLLLYRERTPWDDAAAAIFFGLAFWTDFFDGMIARRTQTITRLGKIMDPLADKLLVLAALLMLVQLDRVNVIVAILILGREVAVSGLRSLAGNEGIMIPSILSAKLKTFAEGFGLGFLILGPNIHWFGLPWMEMGRILLYIGLGLALWSAAIYFREYYRSEPSAPSP